MSKQPTLKETIRGTLEDQHLKTMKVMNSIKGDTDVLLRNTGEIVELLSDQEIEDADKELADTGTSKEEEGMDSELSSADSLFAEGSIEIKGHDGRIRSVETDDVTKEISKICVKEVMSTVSPILNALEQFIKANSISVEAAQDSEDEAFVEKLVEEMKESLGRRQRIALARKRLTMPRS